MAGFTDAERERIREQLVESGRDRFARYGLDKTTIADLVEPAGIAPSTFYQFFDSKERLYLEILEAEGEEFVERVLANSLESEDDPETAVRTFLHLLFEETESNPLFRKLLVEGERERLVRAVPDDELVAARDEEFAFYASYVERWQADGEVRDGDPEALAGAMLAPAYLALHRDELGDYYEPVRDALIEVVAAGLTAVND